MKSVLLLSITLFSLIYASEAVKFVASSCSACGPALICFPCVKTPNVLCSNENSYSTYCCSANPGFGNTYSITTCTGANCCAYVKKLMIGIIVACSIAIIIAALIIIWCRRRALRNRAVLLGGFPETHSETVEVHHYQHAPAQVVQTTTYGTAAGAGYQAPTGYQSPTGYQVVGTQAQVGYQAPAQNPYATY